MAGSISTNRSPTGLPHWRGSDREEVTIRDLLAHASGLTAYLPFYRDYTGRQEFEHAICTLPLEYRPRSQVASTAISASCCSRSSSRTSSRLARHSAARRARSIRARAGDAIPPARVVFHRRANALQPAARLACTHRADGSRPMARTPARRRSPRRERLGARRRRRARRSLRHGRGGWRLRSRFAAHDRWRTDRWPIR